MSQVRWGLWPGEGGNERLGKRIGAGKQGVGDNGLVSGKRGNGLGERSQAQGFKRAKAQV